MPGTAISNDDEATLSQIIRSIDKKLDYSLRAGSDTERPSVTLHLTRQGWEGTTTLDLDKLRTAKTDLVCRNRIRQKIKRLRDHMWDSRFIKDVLGTGAARALKESRQTDDTSRPRFMRRPPKR